MSIISHENWGESLSGYLSAPSEIGGSGDLDHMCLHPQTCLWSQFTWLYHHLYIGALFFPPKSRTKEKHVSKIRFLKAAFRPVSQEIQKYLLGCLSDPLLQRRTHPLLQCFSPNYFCNNKKKHGQSVSFESALTAELGWGDLLFLVTDPI